jgi:hypothetical protein
LKNATLLQKCEKQILECMPGFKDQHIDGFPNFYNAQLRHDTNFHIFLAIVMQFSVILRFFSVQSIEKFGIFALLG